MSAETRLRPPVAYEADYHAWTLEQAEQLRALRPGDLDWENLAEEIESLGGSQKREIRSRLTVALTHLVEWAHQPERRSNSWRASIAGARSEIAAEIEESPSLARYPGQALKRQYDLARLEASGETGLPLDAFPEACPFTVEQVLDPDFWPDAAA